MTKIKIIFARPFLRNLKHLARKYRSVRADVENFLTQFYEGKMPGEQIPGVGYPTYKVRIPSTDAQRGKQGGYRVIYYVQTADQVILLTIYIKSQQENISPEKLRRIIEEELNK